MFDKTYIEYMLDEGGFDAATEMGGFVLDKVQEVSLELKPFWTSILTSSALSRAVIKRFVSNTFVPSGSLKKGFHMKSHQ